MDIDFSGIECTIRTLCSYRCELETDAVIPYDIRRELFEFFQEPSINPAPDTLSNLVAWMSNGVGGFMEEISAEISVNLRRSVLIRRLDNRPNFFVDVLSPLRERMRQQ